jgi:hypothetical protein
VSVQVQCEACERPTVEPIFEPESGMEFCGRCAVEMIGAERDLLRKTLREHGEHFHPPGGWRPAKWDAAAECRVCAVLDETTGETD